MAKNVAKEGSAWYKRWNKSPGYENILETKHAIDNADTVGQCLTLSKGHHRLNDKDTQQQQPLFTLDSEDCNEQRQAICKVEHLQEVIDQGPPPQFPCISNSHLRRKRKIEEEKNGFGIFANL